MKQLLLILSWVIASSVLADPFKTPPGVFNAVDDPEHPRYVARIEAHSVVEIEALMSRAESVVDSILAGEQVEPIQFVLHGDEVRFFFRRNYPQNKALVDRAARLDAFKVIDIKVCETWMRINNEGLSELYPFVDTVPFGPEEEKRLLSEGYLYF